METFLKFGANGIRSSFITLSTPSLRSKKYVLQHLLVCTELPYLPVSFVSAVGHLILPKPFVLQRLNTYRNLNLAQKSKDCCQTSFILNRQIVNLYAP